MAASAEPPVGRKWCSFCLHGSVLGAAELVDNGVPTYHLNAEMTLPVGAFGEIAVRVEGEGCRIAGLGSGFQVSGSRFRVSGFGFRVSGFRVFRVCRVFRGFRVVEDLGFRVVKKREGEEERKTQT